MNTLKLLHIIDLARIVAAADDKSDEIGIEGEIPDIDEGFDGLEIYYHADALEKLSAVQPSRALPAVITESGDGNSEALSRLQDVYAGVFPGELPSNAGAYPYAVHGDELGFSWSNDHA